MLATGTNIHKLLYVTVRNNNNFHHLTKGLSHLVRTCEINVMLSGCELRNAMLIFFLGDCNINVGVAFSPPMAPCSHTESAQSCCAVLPFTAVMSSPSAYSKLSILSSCQQKKTVDTKSAENQVWFHFSRQCFCHTRRGRKRLMPSPPL